MSISKTFHSTKLKVQPKIQEQQIREPNKDYDDLDTSEAVVMARPVPMAHELVNN